MSADPRELQARGDRLRELLNNPPDTQPLMQPWGYSDWVLGITMARCADWVIAVVAAHKAGTE